MWRVPRLLTISLTLWVLLLGALLFAPNPATWYPKTAKSVGEIVTPARELEEVEFCEEEPAPVSTPSTGAETTAPAASGNPNPEPNSQPAPATVPAQAAPAQVVPAQAAPAQAAPAQAPPAQVAPAQAAPAQAAPATVLKVTLPPQCAVPRAAAKCRLKPRSVIHIAILAANWSGAGTDEHATRALLMSILSQSRCKFWVHFLVGDGAELTRLPACLDGMGAFRVEPKTPQPTAAEQAEVPYGERWFGFEPTDAPWAAALLYSLHPLPLDWLSTKLQILDLDPAPAIEGGGGGLPAMAKIFLPDILWQVRHVLYIDPKTIVGGDLQDMWFRLKGLSSNPRILMWLAQSQEGTASFGTGQLVLGLDRMRTRNFTAMVAASLGERSPKAVAGYQPGDQWVFSHVCGAQKTACQPLPVSWNVKGCGQREGEAGVDGDDYKDSEACWRIVHLDCYDWLPRPPGAAPVAPGGWEEVAEWAKTVQPAGVRQTTTSRVWKES